MGSSILIAQIEDWATFTEAQTLAQCALSSSWYHRCYFQSDPEAIWLRNATRLNEAYYFLGSAIRSAHGIGLHRETHHSRLMPLYIDLRQRT